MRVIIDLKEDILDKLEELAKKENRSRKNYMEISLQNIVVKPEVRGSTNIPSLDAPLDLPPAKEPSFVEKIEYPISQDIEKEIAAIRAEIKPSFVSKQNWDKSLEKRINELKNKNGN